MPRKLAESVGFAYRGLIYSLRTQKNLVIHSVVAFLVVLFGIMLRISLIEMAVLILVVSSVIVLELINTAIEEVVNMLIITRKMRAMVSKDVSAAAVLVAVGASVAVGALIFAPKILNLFAGR